MEHGKSGLDRKYAQIQKMRDQQEFLLGKSPEQHAAEVSAKKVFDAQQRAKAATEYEKSLSAASDGHVMTSRQIANRVKEEGGQRSQSFTTEISEMFSSTFKQATAKAQELESSKRQRQVELDAFSAVNRAPAGTALASEQTQDFRRLQMNTLPVFHDSEARRRQDVGGLTPGVIEQVAENLKEQLVDKLRNTDEWRELEFHQHANDQMSLRPDELQSLRGLTQRGQLPGPSPQDLEAGPSGGARPHWKLGGAPAPDRSALRHLDPLQALDPPPPPPPPSALYFVFVLLPLGAAAWVKRHRLHIASFLALLVLLVVTFGEESVDAYMQYRGVNSSGQPLTGPRLRAVAEKGYLYDGHTRCLHVQGRVRILPNGRVYTPATDPSEEDPENGPVLDLVDQVATQGQELRYVHTGYFQGETVAFMKSGALTRLVNGAFELAEGTLAQALRGVGFCEGAEQAYEEKYPLSPPPSPPPLPPPAPPPDDAGRARDAVQALMGDAYPSGLVDHLLKVEQHANDSMPPAH